MAVSFGGIIFIIVRKLPAISLIKVEETETEKLEKERLERIKNEMIIKRIIKWRNNLIRFLQQCFKPVKYLVVAFLQFLNKKLQETKKKYRRITENLSPEEIALKIKNLMKEAEEYVKNKQYDLAEKYYLEALSLDFKNVDVYEAIGWLYIEKKQYKEARESLEFILKLNPNHCEAYYGLAEIARREGKIDEAIEFAKKLVELSPNNPRYLDFLVEMCIIGERADLAKSALEQLKIVNPENQKLSEFEAKIKELKSH